jgi:holo-[acyl-carrier protein] synthase
MILGIGVDVVDVARFESAVERTPGLLGRVLTPAERDRPSLSRAARFAAKEALAKALGAPRGLAWQDVEIVTESSGAPSFRFSGTVLAAVQSRGVENSHLSLTHDGGMALAFVVLES